MSTIRDALLRYVEFAPDLGERTIRKLGYLLTSWEVRTSNPPIEAIGPDVFNDFRRRCLREKLSSRTIESSVTDICTILAASGICPDVGRRLRHDAPDPQCPRVTDLGKWYVACESALSPRGVATTPENYMRAFFVTALWTGFRLQDLFSLTMADFTADGIRRKANKTGKTHLIPNSPVVTRHIQSLAPTKGCIFPHGKTCPTHLRNWIHAVCGVAGVARFGPQNLRIASVNAWRDAGGAEAAGIVHGESLGGRSAIRWYLSRATPIKVLTLAAPRFVWPTEVLLPEERDRRANETQSLVDVASRLTPERLSDLRRVAMAFVEGCA